MILVVTPRDDGPVEGVMLPDKPPDSPDTSVNPAPPGSIRVLGKEAAIQRPEAPPDDPAGEAFKRRLEELHDEQERRARRAERGWRW